MGQYPLHILPPSNIRSHTVKHSATNAQRAAFCDEFWWQMIFFHSLLDGLNYIDYICLLIAILVVAQHLK